MIALLSVAFFSLLFVGSHVVLATPPLRTRLVERFGERGFFLLYSALATVLYVLWVNSYATQRFAGPPGPALGEISLLRWPLMAVAVLGLTIAGAGIFAYPRLPSALFDQPIRQPYGIERVSRHPFFSGIALFAVAHALLVSHLTSVVFFGALAFLSVAGARLQDRKLLARRGAAYESYLAQTSFWPFAAQLRGATPLTVSELPWFALAGAFVSSLWFRSVHGSLFAHGGLLVILAVVGGAAVAAFNAWRRARRMAQGG